MFRGKEQISDQLLQTGSKPHALNVCAQSPDKYEQSVVHTGAVSVLPSLTVFGCE